MFKLILIALFVYFGYSIYLRYNTQSKSTNTTKKNNSKKKFSDSNIRDAEYEDIDDN